MSELTKRFLSAILLAVLLIADLWLGSWWYLALLLVGGALVMREWWRLVLGITPNAVFRATWLVAGLLYVGLAIQGLWRVRALDDGFVMAAWLFLAVWGTDVGGYVFGRMIGGVKVAPAISPSKTWAGVLGGVIFASGVSMAMIHLFVPGIFVGPGNFSFSAILLFGLAIGGPLAVLAQIGDFFESWMKRRAGVKDSGGLIPGHGGLFDRIDGLLPVAIAFPYLLGIAT